PNSLVARPLSAAFGSGESSVAPIPSSATRPAKKPLSQARCSGENGAVSGTRCALGCARACVMQLAPVSPPARVRPRLERTGWAARKGSSFARSRFEHGFQHVCCMALGEGEKCFAALAMRQIDLQDAFDSARGILGLYILVDVASERRVGTKTTAHENVIAVDGIAVVIDCDAGGDQPDVADIVLRAGMMAASEVDVNRWRDCRPRFAPPGDFLGRLFGVSASKAAAGGAGAGHKTSAD